MRVFSFFAESVLHKRTRILKTAKNLRRGGGFLVLSYRYKKCTTFLKTPRAAKGF